jgi:hypothetical protein
VRIPDLIAAFKKRMPERWLEAYPRVYSAPPNYLSSSVPAAVLLNEATMFERDKQLQLQNLTAHRIYTAMTSHLLCAAWKLCLNNHLHTTRQ